MRSPCFLYRLSLPPCLDQDMRLTPFFLAEQQPVLLQDIQIQPSCQQSCPCPSLLGIKHRKKSVFSVTVLQIKAVRDNPVTLQALQLCCHQKPQGCMIKAKLPLDVLFLASSKGCHGAWTSAAAKERAHVSTLFPFSFRCHMCSLFLWLIFGSKSPS